MKNNVSMANFANSSVRLGADANNSSFVTIDTNSMDFVTDSGGSNTTRAAFSDAGIILGSTGQAHISASTHDITIKQSANDYLQIDSDSIEIYAGGANKASFGADPVITGGEVTIRSSANNNDKVIITEDSFKVYDNGTEVSSFGATVVIGEVGASKSNVQITSGAINLRNNTTTKMSLSAAGAITIGNNVLINSSGNATFSGGVNAAHIMATSGSVGGWELGASTLTGGAKILLDQGNSKIVIADDVTSVAEGLTLSYQTAILSRDTSGNTTTANKTSIIASSNTDMVFNADYGNDFYFTQGRIRQWYVTDAGGSNSDPSATGIASLPSDSKISGVPNYDAGIVGVSSNKGGNMTDNEVNAAILGWNSRGAADAACAGVHGLMNRGNGAGIIGEVYGWSSDTSDPAENLQSGVFRGGPMIVGNCYTSSAADISDNDVDYTLIAYPRTKYGANYENRVGINERTPGYALHVAGEIYATGNITAYSDRRSKKNIEFISGSLNLINQLRGVRFDWKKPEEIMPDRYNKKLEHNPVGKQIGMIAQEVQKVIPELVEKEVHTDKLSLKYQNLVGVLVNAVNELTDKVNEQGKQIKELQNGKS